MSADEKESSYPKTLWSATPGKQPRILILDPNDKAKVYPPIRTLRFRDGHVTVANRNEEDTVRRAMAGKVWDQDLTTPHVHPKSAWVCYSTGAWIKYLELRDAGN